MKPLAATFFVAVVFASAACAQTSSPYRITGGALNSGAVEAATNGHYALKSVVGQPAPNLSSSANYRLESGALPAASTVSVCGRLIVTLAGASAVVTWPAELGCVLETATSLSATNWTTVMPQPSGGVLTVPVDSGARFFRLRAP